MKDKMTVINGYEIELEFDCDTSSCWVTKGRYSSSLQLIMDCGEIEDNSGNTKLVKQTTIDKIESWALSNGW